MTEEHFHKQFDLNVLGLILASREAAKHFGPAGGSIINISSLAGSDANSKWLGLQRHESGCRCGDEIACQRTRGAQHSRECLHTPLRLGNNMDPLFIISIKPSDIPEEEKWEALSDVFGLLLAEESSKSKIVQSPNRAGGVKTRRCRAACEGVPKPS